MLRCYRCFGQRHESKDFVAQGFAGRRWRPRGSYDPAHNDKIVGDRHGEANLPPNIMTGNGRVELFLIDMVVSAYLDAVLIRIFSEVSVDMLEANVWPEVYTSIGLRSTCTIIDTMILLAHMRQSS